LWDARTLEPIGARVAHKTGADGKPLPYQVWSVAFGDDDTLVTGSGPDPDGGTNSLLQLWNAQPLSQKDDPMDAHAGRLNGVAFSSDGRWVASAGDDGTLRLWDVKTRRPLSNPISIGQNPVLSLAFAHKHPWMATGGEDGKLRLWDVSSSTPEPIDTPLEGHKDWVNSVVFSPNDDRILSGSTDGNLHLWSPPANVADVICSKVSSNMTQQQWREWVRDSDYKPLCVGLRDAGGN
jgi:WD40 repeat protein